MFRNNGRNQHPSTPRKGSGFFGGLGIKSEGIPLRKSRNAAAAASAPSPNPLPPQEQRLAQPIPPKIGIWELPSPSSFSSRRDPIPPSLWELGKKELNPPKQTLPLHVQLLPPGEAARETGAHVTDVNRII